MTALSAMTPYPQLEKYWRWRIWRGYALPDELYEFELHIWAKEDATDKADYHEALAFPILKPSMDVFGIPRRSRKQRGWYQIVRGPSGRITRPAMLTSGPAPYRPLASGAEVPAELVRMIVADLHTETVNDRNVKSLEIHALGNYALVNRFWANVFQRPMFLVIGFNSRERVMQLLDLLQDPKSRVGGYIFGFHISPQRIAGNPWVHLLSSLYPSLRSIPPIALTVEGPPLTSGARPIRSIHGSLPRAPPSYSSYFREVSLRDVHFQRFDQLLRLVREIRSLDTFQGERLKWDSAPNVPSFLLRGVCAIKPPGVTLTECTDNWTAVWLANLHILRGRDILHTDDYKQLGNLAKLVIQGVKNVNTLYCVPFSSNESSDGYMVCSLSYYNKGSIRLEAAASATTWPNEGNLTTSCVWRITSLSLSYSESSISRREWWSPVNWKIFDKAVDALPCLKRMNVMLLTKEDKEHFDREAASQMECLRRKNKLHLCWVDDDLE